MSGWCPPGVRWLRHVPARMLLKWRVLFVDDQLTLRHYCTRVALWTRRTAEVAEQNRRSCGSIIETKKKQKTYYQQAGRQ